MFFRADCEKIWNAFEQAYVGRNSCDVPVEAYDQVITVAPFTPRCNQVKLTHHETSQRARSPLLMLNNVFGLDDVLEQNKGCGPRLHSEERLFRGPRKHSAGVCVGWSDLVWKERQQR